MKVNRVIGSMLNGMDPCYLLPKDPFCPVIEGILFWLAMLTLQEIETLKQQTLAVRVISSNVEYKFEDLSSQKTKVPTGSKIISLPQSMQ